MGITDVPGSVVLPFFWGSAAMAPETPSTAAQKLLLIGPALSGTGSPSDPGSADAAAAQYGKGSALHRMYKLAKAAYPFGIINCLGVADASGSPVKREVAFAVSAAGTAVAGTFRILIGSEYIDVALPAVASPGDSGAIAAAVHAAALAIDAAFPAVSDQMFASKAAAVLGVSTIQCRHAGTIGNQVRIALDEDTPLPAGYTIAIYNSTTVTANGAIPGSTDPALTVASMGASARWNKVASALDSAWYTTLSAEMTSRWDWSRMLRGHAFFASTDVDYAAAISDLTTTPRTCQFATRAKLNVATRAPAFEVAATLAAVCMRADDDKVGLTVQTLSLPGCQCERIGSEYSAPQRNAITFVGGTTFSNQGGILAIDRCVTTRYQDAYGSRDTRAYDAEDLWLVDYLLTDYQAWAQMMYPRMRLLNDVVGTSLPPDCTSPNGVHDDTVSWYRGHERLGHVQDTETFDKNLKVVIPAGDSKRLDIRLPAEIASNLKLFAVLMTFGN